MTNTMLKHISTMLRRAVISKQEEDVLRVGKAMLFTHQYLQFLYPNGGQHMQILGSDSTQYFGIGNMTLRVDGKSLGWIENIKIELPECRAVVGHFAVAKHLTGIGLAKQFAVAFGNFVNIKYGVTHVLFDELKFQSNPAYGKFFESKLHASGVPSQRGQRLWTIPLK